MPTGNAGSVIPAGHPSEAVTADAMRNGVNNEGADADNVLAGLEGLDMSAATPGLEDAGLLSDQPLISDDVSPMVSKATTPSTPSAASQIFTAGSDKFFQRLCFAPRAYSTKTVRFRLASRLSITVSKVAWRSTLATRSPSTFLRSLLLFARRIQLH